LPLWFWIGALVAAVLLLGLLLMPLRFELSAEARAEPDGQWAAAAGVALGPIALSAVGAHGVPVSVHLFVLGKRRFSHDLSADPEEEEEAEPPSARNPAPSRIAGWFRKRFDPVDGLAFVFGERRRVRWELHANVAYSFRDVALTGKVLAGVYLLMPLLPRGIRLSQTPSWESVDRATLEASGTLRIFAGLVLCDLIWYMLKRSFTPRRKAQGRAASQAWPKPKSSTS
jgi:hypothetical protein